MYLSSPPLLVRFVLLYLCLSCFRLVHVIFVLRFTTSDCPFGIWNFYFLFCFLLLTIMLSVILWFTTSDCSSVIKLFFHIYVLDDDDDDDDQGRIQRGGFFTRNTPKISRLPPLNAILLSASPLTWNLGSCFAFEEESTPSRQSFVHIKKWDWRNTLQATVHIY